MSKINENEIKKRFEQISKFEISQDVTARDLERTRQRLKRITNKPQTSGQNIWRIIMKNKLTKIAVAAVVIIGILLTINQFGGSIDGASVAFAEVVRPLLTTENGRYKMTINVAASDLDWINYGNEPIQTIEVIFSGPSLTRWNIPTGEVLVANMQQGKVMILIPLTMQAAITQVGPPGHIQQHNRFNKLLSLRPLIEQALETENEFVKYLGKHEIEGLTVIGYQIKKSEHHGEITIWADPETKLPIRIEQSMGTEIAVISEITYDIKPEESLFSVQPPKEYAIAAPEEEQTSFVIKGTVIDAVTGNPIAGVKIIDDGYGPKPYKGATTDSQGRYSYATWPEEHSIKAEAPGYKTQTKTITGLFHAENEDGKAIDFALERE